MAWNRAAARSRIGFAVTGIAPWPELFTRAADARVDAALRSLYADVAAAIEQRGPTCWISGRCCNFDAFGHRLYVTAVEIAWCLSQAQATGAALPESIDLTGACAFQRGGLCSIHAIRPLGCRLFFCQEGTEEWQHEQYEIMQRRLREMHEALALPYHYVEWRAGLSEALTAMRAGEKSV